MRSLLKKWYKFKQKQQIRHFNSHWYIRFGWLDQPFTQLDQLKQLYEVHSPNKLTFADCFYAAHDNRHYIFFEEVDDQHPVGFLSVFEVFKDGTHTEPQPVLKLDYHLSYPCVFQIRDDWYMIPETSANKTIELWKCTDFPLKWEKHSNLMENIEAVDSTPFYHEDRWYLFTSTRRNCKKFGDRLDIFHTEDILNPDWKEHPLNPVCKGILQYRMAGKVFHYQDKLIRPSQDSLKRYGGNIEFKFIQELSPTTYKEQLLEIMLPDWNKEDDGCHTINVQENFVVLDAIRLTQTR
ncbi:glucosamine inositolphosphorylceramide transferase family protein [Acinetobacter sp. WZC-1]|uniref:glucosamine inositolphosphorylceramide transferase family protein n=1 Tax=Acinetobacter sp. WZC-1 TaxID=3459034 RepID=UPI00403DC071